MSAFEIAEERPAVYTRRIARPDARPRWQAMGYPSEEVYLAVQNRLKGRRRLRNMRASEKRRSKSHLFSSKIAGGHKEYRGRGSEESRGQGEKLKSTNP